MTGPLVFIHIPRTAGTSFGTVIGNWFVRNGGSVCPYNMWEHFVGATDLDTYDFIGGHTYYPLVRLIKEPVTFITMLGEPVKRIVSHYHHLIDDGRVHPHLHGLTIEQSLEDALFARRYNNLQTRHLAVDFTDIETVAEFGERAQATREDLEFAKERLREFAFVGIKDFFNDSIDKYNRIFGTDVEKSTGRSRPWLDGLSDRAVSLAVGLNELDVELYKFALEVFNA